MQNAAAVSAVVRPHQQLTSAMAWGKKDNCLGENTTGGPWLMVLWCTLGLGCWLVFFFLTLNRLSTIHRKATNRFEGSLFQKTPHRALNLSKAGFVQHC